MVLDGGNPQGIFLRSLGIPVPPEFDDALDTLVPVPEPGEASMNAGEKLPTPREIQVALYDALGLQVPVTDPDALAAQGKTWQPPQNTSAAPTPRDQEVGDQAVSASAPPARTNPAPTTPARTNPDQLPAAADTAPAAVHEDPVGDLVARIVRWATGNVK